MEDKQRESKSPRIVVTQVASVTFAFTLPFADQFVPIAKRKDEKFKP